MMKVGCFSCKTEIEFASLVGRRDECPKCRADVHVCRNCQHYDPRAYNECREPQADVVIEKIRANFCDHFAPLAQQGGKAAPTAEELRKKAEALFSKK